MTTGLDHARLAILVHEVRSPVAALSAVAETVGDQPSDDSMRRELVRLAIAATSAIERIVMDLAVASVRMEPMELDALARDAVAAFVVRGANVVAVDAGGSYVVDGDPVRLRQVLDNLIANALAHGASESSVAVRVSRTKDNLAIAVSDVGPGVRPDELARIFEFGVRLRAGTSGSGIGLTLSREIVQAHGGTLDVESTTGMGSTFTIVLPARSPQPDT